MTTHEVGESGRRRPLGRAGWAAGLGVVVVLIVGSLLPGGAAAAAPDTIFGPATPATVDSGDSHSVALGVKFRSEVAGAVTGIRFYKASTNTGAHVGSLWSASGTLLASATFTGETASGWQQVSFSTPVTIAANTTYIAGYLAPKGHYSDTASGFASSGVSNPPLSALANSTSPDGVYAYSAVSTFPTSSYKATNYWVDVNFEPAPTTPPGQVTNVSATAGPGSATVTWNAPSSGGPVTTYTITPYIGSNAQPATAVNGSPPATSVTIKGLTSGTSYTFTVQASNSSGAGPVSEQSGAVTPSAAPIAYPDLQVLVPTSYIYIAQPTSGTRVLEFEHITSDLGAGPLEIRPTYNSATGISQGYQALYTSPSPGVWTFDHTVPIVGPMVWNPPSDYRFPLDKFWLYSASGGGLGSLVASSPKVDFCMTSDVFVGGVPNAPNKNGYPSSACTTPEGRLGLSVGWGDQYDATDGGEGIDISSLPDGVYWLRSEVDPYHYLQESNLSNDITDTKLQVEGGIVKVLEQTHPDSTPPTVTLTNPAAEATLSGTATLTATANGPAPIASVQFLLDGQPIGTPVTTPPYTMQWTIGSTPAGKHYLSAQATDSKGFIGTAPAVPVTTQAGSGGGEPDKEPPLITITSPGAGATVSGQVQVSANVTDKLDAISSVQFYANGQALGPPATSAPYAITWNTTLTTNGSNTITATATDAAGNVGTSAPVTVTVENPASPGPCFVMDVNTSVEGRGAVTTSGFTTAEPGEQLLAFVASDGPAGAGRQSAAVSGAGLTWTLVKRANSRPGDAEIWWATAPTPLANATVTSTQSASGYDQSLTVIAMQMSNGIGASVAVGAASGAPSVSLTTTEVGSLVFAVGNDYDKAAARTLGTNQVMLHQYLDATGDTYWSQYTGQITGAVGETVTMNDTAPTNDQWNMAAVELVGDGVGK
jgi:hypothetical protein